MHDDRLGEQAFDLSADLLLARHDDGRVGMPGDLPLRIWLEDRELLVDLHRELPDLDDVLVGLHGLATASPTFTIVLRVGLPSRYSRASCAR